MGKKSGSAKQEVIRYYMGIHFGICTGPVDAITRIVVKEKTAWEGNVTTQSAFKVDKDQLFGGRLKEGGVEAIVYWLPGETDQVLADHLAQRLGRANGADTPGYRGIASAFFVGAKGTGFSNFAGGTEPKYGTYWSANNPYLPGVWITVRRAPLGLNPAYALIPSSSSSVLVDTLTFDQDGGDFPPLQRDIASIISNDLGYEFATDPNYQVIFKPTPGGTYSGVDPEGDGYRWPLNAVGDDDPDTFIRHSVPGNPQYATAPLALAAVQSYLAAGNSFTMAGHSTYRLWVDLEGSTDVLSSAEGGLSVTIEIWNPLNRADANPAHIIYECLTNTDWGMGSPAAAIDVANFEAVAIALYSEGFGLSMIWTRQAAIQDFIQEVLDHIQAVVFVDPATGLLTLKLIRGDYDPESLPILTPDNADLTSFSRKLWGEITNEIIVTWTNPETEQDETAPPAQDLASIATQGLVSDSRNYYGVRNASLATQLAWRELRSAGSPLATCEAEVDRTQWQVRPASVLKVTWPEYAMEEVVFRATSVDYGRPGDPTIKLSLIEDIFGLDFGAYEEPPSSGWEDTSEEPEALTIELIFTMPLFFAANSDVAAFVNDPVYPEVVAGILATTTQEDAYAYDLWDEVTLSNGDLQWQELTTNNIIGHATLAADLDAEASSTGVTFANVIGDTVPMLAGFAIIGDEGEEGNEIAMFDGVDDPYDLTRGVLDTVPRAWPAGTPVWFVDGETAFEYPGVLSAGETLDVKLLTRTSQGVLALGDAALVSHDLIDRPWLPNRPAKVEVDGVQFNTVTTPVDMTGRADPWVTISWANRNRLTEDSQVLGWTDATVTPETGQTTGIEVLAEDGITVIDTITGLSGTSHDVPDASFGGASIVLIRPFGERSDGDGDFVSLQAHGIWVQVAHARITEDGEFRITEDDELRTLED